MFLSFVDGNNNMENMDTDQCVPCISPARNHIQTQIPTQNQNPIAIPRVHIRLINGIYVSSVEVENSVRLEKLFSTIQLFNYSTFEN